MDNEMLVSLLNIAIQRNDNEQVRSLLLKKADPNVPHRTWLPLFFAMHCQRPKIFRTLLKFGANANIKDMRGYSPLYTAVDKRLPNEYVVSLLTHHAQVDMRCGRAKKTPLMVACYTGHLDQVKILLQNGANIHALDAQHRTPLLHAKAGGHQNIINYLLENDANPDDLRK